MAVSASRIETAVVPGSERRTVTDIAMDSSYLEGGEEVTAEQLGLKRVARGEVAVRSLSGSEATTVGSAWFEAPKMLLHVNDQKTQAEMASGKDLSKVICRVTAWGV